MIIREKISVLFVEIIGHEKQREFLKKIAKSGKIPHAILFSGQEKLGKKTIALEFISQLFGQDINNHPDLILIEPKGKHPKSERSSVLGSPAPSSALVRGKIQIDQIRELSWKLSLKPVKAPLLAAIVDRAHLMTREAQNCFLKTLEEPKADAILILITEHPSFLLPTIISRCQIIKFYPVKATKIRDFLREKGFEKEKIEEIVEISLGKPGIAIDFFKNPGKLKKNQERIKDLIKISNSPLSFRFQYAKELAKNPNVKEVLNTWLGYFRNSLISQKKEISLAKIENALKNLERTIFLISTTNVNPRLALEILMLEL